MAIDIGLPEQYRGAVIIETTDSYALDSRIHGGGPRRKEFEALYGERGTGWDVIERSPRTQEEMLAQNMGLLVLDVLVMPGVEIPAPRQSFD